MDPYRKPSNLRIAKYYIIKALKFYEMKNERLTPIIFVILLFTGLIGGLLSEFTLKINNDIMYAFYNFLVIFILNIVSTIYLHAFITETKGNKASLKESVSLVFRNLFKIIFAHIVFLVIIMTGMLLLIVPAIIFYYTYMFNICYIVDKDIGVKDAFNASKIITTGKKLEIFAIFILFNLMTFFPLFLVILMASASGNNLIFSFVPTFFATVLTLMQRRMTAMIYIDLEYNNIKQ